eukprot:GDKH01006320.1.p1 GENE.GDKH01006320.1~~GDKH01006320.1.p1  ORF type:complete len:133 (+),score=11.81 GDKH01006320.1:150-548(+)
MINASCVGWWWVVVSLFHAAAGISIYWTQWTAIVGDGWFNAVSASGEAAHFDRRSAFWFMYPAPIGVAIGVLAMWAERRKVRLPTAFWAILLVTDLVGLTLLPKSGLWLLLPPLVASVCSSNPSSLTSRLRD